MFTCLLASLPQYALSSICQWGQLPPTLTNVGASFDAYHVNKIRFAHLSELELLQDDWDHLGRAVCDGAVNAFSAFLRPDLTDELGSHMVTDIQPHILAAKANKHDADNPSFKQAINSPFADK